MDSTQRRIRWWPVWLILALTGLALLVIRLLPQFSHQQRNIFSAATLVIVSAALMLWLVLFSRMRWAARLTWLAALLLGGLGARTFLTIRGVSGDLLPILDWRFRHTNWAKSRDHQSKAPAGPAATNRLVLVSATDYPQYLGPSRNGVVLAPRLATDWQRQPPELLWRKPVGAAWSGFAVAGQVAVTLEQRGEEETVVAYDLLTGAPLWTHSDPDHYHTTIAGEGPRTTPTVTGSRVFTMGARGRLNCLDLATGRLFWSHNVVTENQGDVGEWGVSCSPLVLDGQVIVTTGAGEGHSLVAYDVETGRALWSGGNDPASYSSPIAATLAGAAQVLVFDSRSVAAHDPRTGALLWQHPWPTGHPHITPPLLLERDRLLVSSGYGTGSELLEIQRPQTNFVAKRLWKSIRLKSKFANLISFQGCIYGLDDGILVCLDPATGDLKWKEGRYGHGQMILVSDLLLIMAENGDVALVRPSPQERHELTRFAALRTKTWNPPALAGTHLLVRNDLEAACYLLPFDGPGAKQR